MFLRKVGTIILVVTAVLWVLINFPAREAETAHMDEAEAQSYVMEHSFAGWPDAPWSRCSSPSASTGGWTSA